jgi:hypothetical protein
MTHRGTHVTEAEMAKRGKRGKRAGRLDYPLSWSAQKPDVDLAQRSQRALDVLFRRRCMPRGGKLLTVDCCWILISALARHHRHEPSPRPVATTLPSTTLGGTLSRPPSWIPCRPGPLVARRIEHHRHSSISRTRAAAGAELESGAADASCSEPGAKPPFRSRWTRRQTFQRALQRHSRAHQNLRRWHRRCRTTCPRTTRGG